MQQGNKKLPLLIIDKIKNYIELYKSLLEKRIIFASRLVASNEIKLNFENDIHYKKSYHKSQLI